MVERRRDPADRRRHVVTITPAGKKKLEELRRLHERIDDDMFAPLTAAEVKTLTVLLAKLAAAHEPRYQA
jgi:DNA-binding MarR family transcriptional regulator